VIPISILDLVPVIVGKTPREALRKNLDLVQRAEEFGYTRYWVAEHHTTDTIDSLVY
jgi:alkanesulfonate monooxygenase SsuD/methylene tetrahydromethanopterin reductase-like flavin-dependent oxidoreductase (luciferase family)